MKYMIILVFVTGLVAGSAYYVSRSSNSQNARAQGVAATSTEATADTQQSAVPMVEPVPSKSPVPVEQSRVSSVPGPAAAPAVQALDRAIITQAVDVLLSRDASYEQKRGTWKQLRESGGLDEAINQLQQRLSANPSSGDCAAVLGHAYLQKCGTISDVREQGILALQADKLFDTALSLDPQNWEARFTKAVALSYWPANMGKGDEVIQQFQTLIQQQEALPQQPQFSESYTWLGDQYKKLGRLDDAHSIWERGALLFPSDPKLSTRLASTP
ncbi:MAG TPA: hypothetical protein VFE51_07910 [Verrucomicrobiae bacterium]|nr:hypothetical protein [Verrucomicrobiae bacterium]